MTVEDASSEQNPELSVVLDKGRFQLLSGDAIYSWDDLYRNFDCAFETLQLKQYPYQDVLLLGLGLGSVPFLLEKKYKCAYYYTAVEWDETVADLAERYTLSRLTSPVETVIADAEVFIDVCEADYDLIIVDIFEDDLTPPQFETKEFLIACDRLLRPGGILLFNRLYSSIANKTFTTRFFERKFKTVFPNASYIDTKGNWILVYQKQNHTFTSNS